MISPESQKPREGGEVRRLGGMTASLLVVASMVGTGVFTTTGFLVADLGSSPAVLVAWLVGGIFALCGALAYSELVAALPRNGGEYHLLGRIYHPAVGFVAGWISFIVGFSAPIAASSLAFGKYLAAIAGPVPPALAATCLVLALSCLHALHVVMGGGIQNGFTVAKVGLILALIAGGVVAGEPQRILTAGGVPLSTALVSPQFAIGLIFISFCYSGWNGAAYLAGEIRKPARTLPIALFTGTAIVTVLYLGLNAVFLSSADSGELAGVLEVGHVAAVRLFGQQAGTVLSAGIALALVSSVSAMIMSGPRVYHAMGEDYRALAFLSYRTRRGGPAWAVSLQALAALVMVLTASFEALLTYIGFTLSLCAGLTVIGVLVLRAREPELSRPYRVWGYPFTPILFALLCIWMAVHAIFQRPVVALAGLGTVASGLVLYLLLRRSAPGRSSA